MKNMPVTWILFLLALPACADQGASPDLDQAKEPKGDWAEFDLTIRKGDSVFIGMEDSDPGLHEVAKGVRPEMAVTLPLDSKHDEMTLRLRVNNAGSGTLEDPWLFQGNVHRGKPEDGRTVLKQKWQDPDLSVKSEGQPPTKEMIDPELKPVDDLKADVGMWTIPYVKVNGHVRSVVIAKARTVDELKKVIRIPRVYILFQWDIDELK